MTFSIIKRKTKTKIKFHLLGWSSKIKFKFFSCLPFAAPRPFIIWLQSISPALSPTSSTQCKHTAVLQRLILTLSRSVRVCTAQHLLLSLLDYPLPSPGMWAKISLAGPSSMPALRQTSPLFTLLLQPLYHSTSATLRWFNYASLFPTGQPENS